MKNGFDAPIKSEDQDRLDRVRFATDIYRIAIETPPEWSVRIGVFGKWGSGKTSILNLVDSFAEEDNQFVAWFKPWGLNNAEQVWVHFLDSVEKSFLNKKINLSGKRKRSIKKFITEKKNKIAYSPCAPELTKLIGTGISIFGNHLTPSQKDLIQFKDFLGENRMIILVDDLDRANPRIVAELLLITRELFDIQGFSFVFAFDPKVINQALELYHKGLTGRGAFIDKIIDFQKWIPEPRTVDLLEMVKSDIDKYCPNVDTEALKEIEEYLPNNPRKIGSLVRNMWLCHKQLDRFDVDELEWEKTHLANVLITLWPNFFMHFALDRDLKEKFRSLALNMMTNNSDRDSKNENEIEDSFKKHWENSEEDGNASELSVAIMAAKRLITGKNFWRMGDSESTYFYLFRGEHPITRKELKNLLNLGNNKEFFIEDIASWIDNHLRKWKLERLGFYRSLLSSLIYYRDREFDVASSTPVEKVRIKAIENGNTALRLLLCLISDGGRILTNAIDEEFFIKLFRSFRSFIYKKDKKFIYSRQIEKKIMNILCSWNSLSVEKIFLELVPWHKEPPVRDEDSIRFREEVIQKLSRLLLIKVINRFEKPRVDDFILSDSSRKWLVFDDNSVFWEEDNVKSFMEIAERAKENEVLQGNTIRMISLIHHGLDAGIPPASRENFIRIAKKANVMKKLWEGAVYLGLNKEIEEQLIESARKIEEICNEEIR
ncbi:hypothetical protein GF369_00180 [Candidatus Peregrinibacteria bacterium]|nr:hypothetical protein [Candidatus Peregrinibacteria bacterium]